MVIVADLVENLQHTLTVPNWTLNIIHTKINTHKTISMIIGLNNERPESE